ncbi:MAG: DUF4276 family protein [Candidatus Hydrogenedentes bacterium]|nr:DUF4276 family protein [Candidatus Hydrogenedentota bacterium]
MVTRRPLIGLVVEGTIEYSALPDFIRRLGLRATRPACLHGQPVEAPTEVLVSRHLAPHVRAQLLEGADYVWIVIDLESRRIDADEFCADVLGKLIKEIARTESDSAARRLRVAICDRTFENWLLADPKGLRRCKLIGRDLSKQVRCHADGKDAITILKSAMSRGVRYHKPVHSSKLARYIRVEDSNVKLCSESLRTFVKALCSIP